MQKPAISLLSSGHVSYPLNRPLAACAETDEAANPASKGGRIAAIGSVQMFADEWIGKEDNEKILEVILRWLCFDDAVVWDHSDAQDPDTNDYHNVPHTEALAERPRSCLQEPEGIPKAFSELFAGQLYGMDTKVRYYGIACSCIRCEEGRSDIGIVAYPYHCRSNAEAGRTKGGANNNSAAI